MSTTDRGNILQKATEIVIFLIGMGMLFSNVFFMVSASTDNIEVPGKVYEFDKNNQYKFSDSENFVNAEGDNTYGVFSVGGNISNVGNKNGVPSYEVAEGSLALFYNYGDTLLNAGEDSWHLVDDKSKKVDTLTLDSNVMKGTVILQTSRDRKTWINVDIITNAFSDIPVREKEIYSTTDIQLINGCFYRVIIVYELCIRIEENRFLFINTDKYDYKKCVEIYEFYAFMDNNEADIVDLNQIYSLGEKVRVDNFDGYFGKMPIDKDDIHYGWDLGNFFVSGYTDEIVGADGNMVFLKNVGDKVTLWFKLNENINGLNGQDNLAITADTEGYDQYFETPKINFGRGTLIIRYTDYNNIRAEPIIYTNYLEANATVGVDTKVRLFEEGDYEVALDYEVTCDKLIDKIVHYRIFFKFSVRNGNCMVYPFDVVTGKELTNSTMTENGFRLDLAKSRYLKVIIKREVMKDSADGLVEDIRFNGPVKDGAEYRDEGIYTITVHNEYTNQFTVKKIYVGTNNVLRAHMTTGLSILEINKVVASGATIFEDGTIQLASGAPSTEPPKETPLLESETMSDNKRESYAANGQECLTVGTIVDSPIVVIIGSAVVCIATILIFVFRRCNARQLQENSETKGDTNK